jgi:hypothetical protein
VTRTQDETMSTIKTKLSDNCIWVSADETTDIKGRCVVNVIVGILNLQIPYELFLNSTECRNSVNTEEICERIKQAIAKVSNSGGEKICLFLTLQPSCLKLSKLKKYFPRTLHLPTGRPKQLRT